MEYLTDGGLLVTDRRHQRASENPQVDPRTHTPNLNVTGPENPSSVGPQSEPGQMMVAGLPHPESWDGWPAGWHTPPFGDEWSGTGFGRQMEGTWGRTATAMTCVDLASRQLASFPIYGIRNNEPFALPAWHENPEPEIYSCWGEFIHDTVNSMLLRGESFTYVTGRYADGRIARFISVSPDDMGVEWIDGHYEYLMAGNPVPAEDIVHVRYQSLPGRVRGISPLEWCGRSMSTSASLERYAANLAGRGGIPWAVLKTRGNIDKTQAETIQQRWIAAASRRDGAPAVMGGDIDLVPLTLSPRDMALLELREFDERRICAAFGTPSYLVNVEQASSMTYANSTDLRIFYWQATLRPLAQLLADAWSARVLALGTRIEFNPDRFLQPSLAERSTAWATLFGIFDPRTGTRAMEVEEVRAAERMMPVPTLDQAQRLTGSTA